MALRRSAAVVWQERPALGARSDQATAKLAGARAALKGRAGSPAELARATRLTGDATRELQAVRDEANGRLERAAGGRRRSVQGQATERARQEEARRQVLRQELAALTQEATVLEASVGAAGARPEVRQAQADLGRSRSRALGDGGQHATNSRPRDAHRGAVTAGARGGPGRAVAPARRQPRRPWGDRRDTLAGRCTPGPPRGCRGVPRGRLPPSRRAAHRVAGERAQGGRGDRARAGCGAACALPGGRGPRADVLDAARADIRACRRLDATVAPDTAFFSPSFVALFEETR